ncbi:MAG: CpsD/CapB family tyrosine-protein kinase [Rhodobacteraceae bacterium]|nr:CpsD/CapB family tyrosine-protein kinase [Paracoccaceae bacterium]
MVNTRILEQRLGWRTPDDGDTPTPPTRPIAHQPILQGRVDPAAQETARRGAPVRTHRRAEIEETWADIPVVLDDVNRLAAGGAAPSIARGSVAGAAMDQLRTQLLRVTAEKGWRRIGVTSAARGAGRSFVAAGLAASIARLETLRVLLIDADLDDPGLAHLLDLDAPGPLDAVLQGLTEPQRHLRRVGNGLALALNDSPVPQASERMLAPDAILALRSLIDCVAPEVVIHDMPPLIEDPVAAALLPQLDAVLLVADGFRTTAQDILDCERVLDGQAPLLGVVLNKSEDRDPRASRRRG